MPAFGHHSNPDRATTHPLNYVCNIRFVKLLTLVAKAEDSILLR